MFVVDHSGGIVTASVKQARPAIYGSDRALRIMRNELAMKFK